MSPEKGKLHGDVGLRIIDDGYDFTLLPVFDLEHVIIIFKFTPYSLAFI
jgi:hypothetical protein